MDIVILTIHNLERTADVSSKQIKTIISYFFIPYLLLLIQHIFIYIIQIIKNVNNHKFSPGPGDANPSPTRIANFHCSNINNFERLLITFLPISIH